MELLILHFDSAAPYNFALLTLVSNVACRAAGNSDAAPVARLGDAVADVLVPILKNTSCKLHEINIRYLNATLHCLKQTIVIRLWMTQLRDVCVVCSY